MGSSSWQQQIVPIFSVTRIVLSLSGSFFLLPSLTSLSLSPYPPSLADHYMYNYIYLYYLQIYILCSPLSVILLLYKILKNSYYMPRKSLT